MAKVAERAGANASEVARFNGLLPNTPLPTGRVIKIPSDSSSSSKLNTYIREQSTKQIDNSGVKPVQQKDGKIQAVMNYFNETFHDPYSMRFVRWSPISKVFRGSNAFWAVTVKLRAKNTLGAYVLSEETYYIQNNKVVKIEKY